MKKNEFGSVEDPISMKTLMLLIGLAYLFSLMIRMIWVFQFQGTEGFTWNSELMINTNDGYYFATAVKDVIFGTNGANPQLFSAATSYPGVVYSTLFFYKILPFSLDTIILYMPAFISSLIVIPIILITRLFHQTWVGFFAALIGSIAWSYYNRTMVGYYDSDMFAVLMQVLVLYGLLSILKYHNLVTIALTGVMMVLYPLFYPQGLSLIYAMYMILIVYLLLYHRKEDFFYHTVIILSVALLMINPYLKIGLILGLLFLLKQQKFDQKLLFSLAIGSFVVFLFGANIVNLIMTKISVYLDRGTEDVGLKFFQVIQTVREAGQIPFEVMANRISGSVVGVIVSLVGYIILVIKYRPFILALPLIGIGVFSLWGGLRFTVYAVPIAAISAVFLFFVLGSYAKEKWQKYLFVVVMTAAMLYPNITHILGYKVPTVFMKQEVAVLDKLNTMASGEDYTLAWWDYGYPIWYYSDTNTLIDGSKHHNDNFIISKILNSTSQVQAANLSRVAVETYVSSKYATVADTLFKNKTEAQLNPNHYLEQLESDDFELPKSTRDIYLFLPNRLLNIFPTVGLFSNIDLQTGIKGKQPFFYKTDRFKDDGGRVYFGNGVSLDKSTSTLHLGQQKTSIKRFTIVGYDQSGNLSKKVQSLNPNAELSIIFMQSYNSFLILDESMYNSLFIQLFIFENYDKDLFDLVINDPYAKVYKLKR